MPLQAIAATVTANKSRLDELEQLLQQETQARLTGDAAVVHLREIAVECLEALTLSRDVVDVNVAAGVMLERLDDEAVPPALYVSTGFVTHRVFALWVAAAALCGTLFPATYLWNWLL